MACWVQLACICFVQEARGCGSEIAFPLGSLPHTHYVLVMTGCDLEWGSAATLHTYMHPGH